MKISSSILATLLAASTFSCFHAQTTDAPPVDPNSIISKLEQIKQKQDADIKSTEKTLAQNLMMTASSPSDALNSYEAAIIATQFSGLNHEAKEVQDWTKRHEAEFKDPNFQTALCLHLMYLSLTISHDAGVKTKDLLPTLLAYIQQVQAYQARLQAQEARNGGQNPANTPQAQGNGTNFQGRNGGRNNPAAQQAQQAAQANQTDLTAQEGLMESSLAGSIFVRYREIGQYVTDDEKWELIPIKTDNIFQKVILPEYRLEKNATGIFQYWDSRIQNEEAVAASTKRPVDMDQFTNVTEPSLQWQRAEEYVGLGMRNTAITTMVSIIQAHQYHPDATAWIDEVEKLVKNPTATLQLQPAVTSASPASATAPATAPAPVVVIPGSGAVAQPAPN